ncbi:MAG: glycosyltransferase [Chthoniobacteraceae bacterium]
MPRLSVIMPVFNAAPYLREAVQSVLDQTFRDFELIIVDDGSTDESREIAQGIDDGRIRIFYNGENLGAAAAKNLALEKARGEFIAFLDADDVALPHRFEAQCSFLGTHPDVSLVASCVEVIDAEGALHGRFLFEEMSSSRLCAKLLFYNPIAQSSVMLRSSCLTGMTFRSECEPAEDYDLWATLSQTARMVVLEDVLVHYRSHPEGISRRKEMRMEDSVVRIASEQLGRLGISPSGDQLKIHRDFSRNFSATPRSLSRAEAWLGEIREANARLLVYDSTALEEVVSGRWADFVEAMESLRRSHAPWRRLARGVRRGMKLLLARNPGS